MKGTSYRITLSCCPMKIMPALSLSWEEGGREEGLLAMYQLRCGVYFYGETRRQLRQVSLVYVRLRLFDVAL
jgi:hypothetical protein